MTNDNLVDSDDLLTWVHDLKGTWLGDANLDGEFSSADLVTVFQNGKYETELAAGWGEGDWNADGRFSSSDFLTAFQDGGFEQGLRSTFAAVPEPTCCVLAMSIGFGLYCRRRIRCMSIQFVQSIKGCAKS